MRRIVLCLALFLLPGAAYAADGGWSASMQDTEGGPAMVASVTGQADGNVQPTLELMCAGDKGVALRYSMASDDGQPGGEADFLFENEHDQITRHMVYEDEDGAFAAYFPANDPMISLLETGQDAFLSEATGNYPNQDFPLTGSTKAIAAVLKTCK
jgi:hypothetical protein